FVANLSPEQLKDLRSDPRVDYIEQDRILSLDPIVSADANQTNAIWGLDRIDQRNLPLDNNYSANFDGTGVTAYVIDTGVNNAHVEFSGRSVSGYDFVDNDADASDCNGHGTHVAGTTGGSLYGVAKHVNLVGVRVLSSTGSGSTSGVIAGVDWVAANASGPSVANMS
ncbi:S8 family serine peptidase, partial [Vibrio parahaemolyticus]|nr:S8 family serine peptidase [Vibrio parahaemolyticus]